MECHRASFLPSLAALRSGEACFINPKVISTTDGLYQRALQAHATGADIMATTGPVRVYHVSTEPFDLIVHDPTQHCSIGSVGFSTTTDPLDAAGRKGTAYTFVADLTGLEPEKDYATIGRGYARWYIFKSKAAKQRLARVPGADQPVV